MLAALQAVQLGCLRCAKPAREVDEPRRRGSEAVTQAELRRDIRELVGAVRRSGVKAAAEAAFAAVIAGIARQHPVVVVVMQPLGAQADAQRDGRRQRELGLNIGRDAEALHVEIIVAAGWPRRGEKRRPGRRALLRLLQE